MILRRAIVLAAGLALSACGLVPRRPPAEPMRFAPLTPANPPASMRMTLLSVAEIETAEADAIAGGDRKKKLKFPVIVAYVEHPNGNVLIDSGFGTRYPEHVRSFPANLFNRLMKPKMNPARDPAVRQLSGMGVEPSQVDWLLATHMHWDHIGGLGDFPKARLTVPLAEWNRAKSGGELTWAMRGYADSMYAGLRPETMLIVWPNEPAGTFKRSVDLYGDGSIVLLDTSGHTPGSMSVLVTLPTGERFLFIGDAAWIRRNYRERRHKGWRTRLLDNSRRGVMPTLERIAELERLVPGLVVVPAHDPEAWAELRHAPHWYGGDELAAVVETILAGGKSLEDLQAMPALDRADFVYERIYGADAPKAPARITQADHERALSAYERKMEHEGWHVRAGVAGQAGEGPGQRRFYFNLVPDEAARFTQALTEALNAAGVPFTMKLPLNLEDYERSSAGVLYVPVANYAAAKRVVIETGAKWPAALSALTPVFTKPIAPGIGAAHEPDPALPAPQTRPRHSFGTLRGDAIAEALASASTEEALPQLARERLVHYGLDPRRPWLNRATDDDDL